MNPNLLDISELLVLCVVFSLRTIACFILLPPFASSFVPASVRLGIGMAIILPVVASRQDLPLPIGLDAWSLVLLVAREGTIGLVIGLGFGALCAAMQSAGEMIDHQTGLTFTQNIDPTYGNQISITSHLFERVLFAALMSAGLMLLIVDALYLSYELWPVGQALPTFERIIPLSLTGQSSRLFALALLLAGPVLLVLFVVDASVGMLNRAAPQLNVFNITLSIKPIVGLIVLALAMPMVIEYALKGLVEFSQFMRMLIAMKV
jgi:type III secretion protein T